MAVAYHALDANGNPPRTIESPLMLDRLALHKAKALGANALYIYIQLVELAGDRDRAFTSNDELAALCDVSISTVQRSIKKLIEATLIRCTCKGNGRGLKSVYVILPQSEKGVTADQKGVIPFPQRVSTDAKRVSTGAERVSTEIEPTPEKGVKPLEKGVTAAEKPAHILVNTEIVNTPHSLGSTHRGGEEVDIENDLAELLAATDIQILARQYSMTDALLRRSLTALLREWRGTDVAGNPKRPPLLRTRIRNACGWLRSGEQKGIHTAWRKEAPYEMAGALPV